MSLIAGQEAIRISREAGLDEAEQFLEDHYNGEPVDNWLRWYANLPEFRPRRELLGLAWEDHRADRYHASVPVVLAQIDGIAYDMADKTFYKQQEDGVVHLTATETVAGDPSGLASLARLISAKRDITATGPISIAYRHGILHGRDLGYASRRTSTKAFATLLALRPWVLKIRSGEQFTDPLDQPFRSGHRVA